MEISEEMGAPVRAEELQDTEPERHCSCSLLRRPPVDIDGNREDPCKSGLPEASCPTSMREIFVNSSHCPAARAGFVGVPTFFALRIPAKELSLKRASK